MIGDMIRLLYLGLNYGDYHVSRQSLEKNAVFPRTVMLVYLASDSIVERLLIRDIVLAASEWFAVEKIMPGTHD